MRYVFIFEDKYVEDASDTPVPITDLLKSCKNSENIYFLGGSRRYFQKFKDTIYVDSDCITYFLFYDVSLNNVNTVNGFFALKNSVKKLLPRQNVCVVPIPYLEYFVLKMLSSIKVLNTNEEAELFETYLFKNFDWKSFIRLYQDGKYERKYSSLLEEEPKLIPESIRSLEKAYKFILGQQVHECMINNFNKGGTFYMQDCNCEGCTICNKSRAYKAECLYTRLPVFDVISDEHEKKLKKYGFKWKDITISELETNWRCFYKMIFKSMGEDALVSIHNLGEE